MNLLFECSDSTYSSIRRPYPCRRYSASTVRFFISIVLISRFKVAQTAIGLPLDKPIAVDAFTKNLERLHGGNLATYMEMQSAQPQPCIIHAYTHALFHIVGAYAELVFLQTGGDVMMGMGIDIRVYAQSHGSFYSAAFGYRGYDAEFFERFHIEASYALPQTQLYLAVGLSHAGKENVGRPETGVNSSLYLAAAHAVGAEALTAYDAQYAGGAVGLHRIVHLDRSVAYAAAYLRQCILL